MFPPEHMRAARAAMLQAAIAAFFADVEDDGDDNLRLDVSRDAYGRIQIDLEQCRGAIPTSGYSL